MSVFKIIKANLITQMIWFVVVGVMMLVVGLFKTSPSAKGSSKKATKDGFQSEKAQKMYDHYVEKEMQYGE